MEEYKNKTGNLPDWWEGLATVASNSIKDPETLKDATLPLMKWLNDNHTDYVKVIVTPTSYQIIESSDNQCLT